MLSQKCLFKPASKNTPGQGKFHAYFYSCLAKPFSLRFTKIAGKNSSHYLGTFMSEQRVPLRMKGFLSHYERPLLS
jgi:hypothetical protein